jgi:hypothetical protein
MDTRNCPGFDREAHDVPLGIAYWRNAKIKFCRECDRAYRVSHAKSDGRIPKPARAKAQPRLPSFAGLALGEVADDDEMAHSHEYVPSPEFVKLWHSLVKGAQTRPASNLFFTGPSGTGKTDGARYLAALVGLPFTKVDAASMTDPESWFGTREIVVQDGVAVTEYKPSAFVEAIQAPGVTLIDEANRVRDEQRQVLNPLLDTTRQVMNPLTGQIVRRHPQNFIVLTGNIGLHYTGTSAIDPSLMNRVLTVEFDYLAAAAEEKIVVDASGCDAETAHVFVRLAQETRAKARSSDEFVPISVRQLIAMGERVADGLDRDLAVKFVLLDAASSEGGASSVRATLEALWTGVRQVRLDPAAKAAAGGWTCPAHGQAKVIPAGISSKTSKPYAAFKACPVFGCQNTEDRTGSSGPTVTVNGQKTCTSCSAQNPAGRNAFCVSCGATLP